MGKTVNANNSNKSKHVAKKVGVSVAKMLHKKAIQRVRKAKGMQKTNGKGCPPTASVKTTNTHSARGRPPLRTAGGVSHTARNSKTELKTAVPEVKIQPVQHTPVASTDEEGSTRKNILPSKVANRYKSTSSTYVVKGFCEFGSILRCSCCLSVWTEGMTECPF